MKRYLFACLLPCLSANVSAQQVYKCIDSEGHITFSQMACQDSTAGEAVRVHPANSMNAIGRSPGSPSTQSPRADKYVRPLDLSGDIQSRFRQVKAVVDVGVQKARDCEWDMRVTENMDDCKDFLAFIVEGSEYNQALGHMAQLDDSDLAQIQSRVPALLRSMEEVAQVKTSVMAYIRNM